MNKSLHPSISEIPTERELGAAAAANHAKAETQRRPVRTKWTNWHAALEQLQQARALAAGESEPGDSIE